MQYLNEWIPLIGSFRAGTYTLQVNGAHVEFHLIITPTVFGSSRIPTDR